MGRKKNKSNNSLGWLALIGGAVLIFINIIVALLPLILIIGAVYFYFKWQKKKLAEYDNDWKAFYENELKQKVKIAAVLVPVSLGIMVWSYRNYQKQEKERLAIEAQAESDRLIKEAEIQLAMEAKQDSSQHYLDLANKNIDRKRYKQSLLYLDTSLQILRENNDAWFKRGFVLRKQGKYQDAIDTFDDLLDKPIDYKDDIYLEKGRCLLKLNKEKEAVAAVYNSKELGNQDAEKLYEIINPIVKQLTGYRRRCCDGTTSYSEGKGTCSSHGGVCKWNEPMYREGRKYILK